MRTFNTISVLVDTTLGEFLSQYVLLSGFSYEDFLSFRGDNDSTNYDILLRSCPSAQQTSNESIYNSGQFGQLFITGGTVFYIENSKIKREVLRQVEPDQFTLTDFKPFITSALAKLILEPRYTSTLINDTDNQVAGSITVNDFTVLMWVRSLSSYDQPNKGSWVNISPFVEGVQINSTGGGGSFSLQMQPITCSGDPQTGWVFRDNVQAIGSDTLVSESIMKVINRFDSYNPGSNYKRNDFFFHTAVQKNDLVMIRLEKLDIEKERPTDFDLSSHQITGEDKIYDMIGMVDMPELNTTPGNVNVSISGRDLTKILIEENSVFFPEQFAQGIFNNADGVLSKRNLIEKDLNTIAFASYSFKSISTIVKFIFNKYSNIGYVPDESMTIYGIRAVKNKYALSPQTTTTTPSVTKLQITADVTNPSKSVVTTTTDTGTIIQLSNLSEAYLKQKRAGLWQIMEVVIDAQVAQRVLVDNNIVHDQGSIINGLQKICQMPFVQFYTDTYGDKFYLIIRKPPFDEQGYKGMVYEDITTIQTPSVSADDTSTATLLETSSSNSQILGQSSLVIDINDINVLSENLVYHDEVYTWFRLMPRGLNNLASFALLPIITLDEYAEVWGSRPLSVDYNYCPAEYVQDSNVDKPLNYLEQQLFKDLQFLVQSYQYMPFVRRGTITIVGDRRIKKGMFIRYNPTDEIFYVESVSHIRSISGARNIRSTTVQVTRGMREKYIKGVDVQFASGVKKVSYFNLINTKIPVESDINHKEFLRDWKVDSDIFNFFLQRRQWN